MAGKKTGNNKVRKVAVDIIMVCLAAIVLVSGWKVYNILHDYKVSRDTYDKIAELAMPKGFTGEINFDALHKVNKDVIAWIYYESTHINYPVLRCDNNDQYLRASLDGTWAIGGSIFVEAATEKPFRQFNTIVYGHHMQDGSMFADLEKLKDPEYAAEHPQLELVTPEKKYHLRVCAFLNEPSDSDVYTPNISDDDEEGKQKYIDEIRDTALYTTGEKMRPDDRYVVLSNYAYEYEEARYIVICKMTPWK